MLDKKKLLCLVLLSLVLTACSNKKTPSLSPTPIPSIPSIAPTVEATLSATPGSIEPLEMNGTNITGLPLKAPSGFTLSMYAKDLQSPRVLIADANNTALVSVPSQNKVVAIKDGGESQKTLIDKLNAPHGLALSCESTCRLYVGETNGISVYEYRPEQVIATNGKRILELPTGGRHTTKTLQLISTAQGTKLLISVGSSCDVCTEKDIRRASILIADLDGKNAKVYASGLRNSVFMTEQPQTHQIWATEMGRDFLGDDLPPDEINIIAQDKNYGWPLCYGQNLHDTDFDKKLDVNNPCKEPAHTPSHIDLPAHSAPLGLSFVTGNWPESLRNNLLVSYHGSWNRSSPTGYKIVRIILDDNGNFKSKEDFITGWLDTNGKSIGRPVGLTFDTKGNLLITDDKLGNIYKLSYTK